MAFLPNLWILNMSFLKGSGGGVMENPMAAVAVVPFSMVDLSRGWVFFSCLF